jgi:(1->4)-alpha-D-glucan 1-alpha-D-glucosylmutase
MRYAERLAAWQQKSLREAKLYSSWVAPNEEYEQACRAFLMALFERLRSGPFLDDVVEWVRCITPASIANSLTQTLMRLTVPGMPDLYQGTEFWDFSLVDPDNRRPVDYEARRTALTQEMRPSGDWQRHQPKQALIRKLLALRTAQSELFAHGSYTPLLVQGPLADHVIAFLREHEGRTLLVAALRFNLTLVDAQLALKAEGATGKPTRILLPAAPRDAIDVLQGTHCEVATQVDVHHLLGRFPVAVLMYS